MTILQTVVNTGRLIKALARDNSMGFSLVRTGLLAEVSHRSKVGKIDDFRTRIDFLLIYARSVLA